MARDSNDQPMSLGAHLDELRRRLIMALLGVVPIFVIGLIYGKTLMDIIVDPLRKAMRDEHIAGSMMATNPIEGFMTYLKIAALLAVVFGAPWMIFQVWKFVAPGLYAREKRFVYVLGPMSAVLSAAGVAFMYYVMLPFALMFFVHFNAGLLKQPPTPVVPRGADVVVPVLPHFKGDPEKPKIGEIWINTDMQSLRVAVPDPRAEKLALKPDGKHEPIEPSSTEKFVAWLMGSPAPKPLDADVPVILSVPLMSDSFVAQQYKLNEYVSLVLWFALAFALTFQTPVVVLLLGWAGIVDVPFLSKYRKHVAFICTAVAAITTPPDAISMISLAVPMYLLFEFGLILLRLMPAKRVAKGFGKGEPRDGESDPDDDSTTRPDDR